jgi:hypothetical protein
MPKVWPFPDPPNTAVFTTVHVLERRSPITIVTHDADDGGWQFLCGTTNADADARVVGLGRVLDLDPTVAELADLPFGWRAWRGKPKEPWQRSPRATAADEG